MKRGLLVYNPTAGQRDRRAEMSALIDRQRRLGLELVNAPTSGPGDATAIVRSFLTKGLDVVAVCGGDGTVSEAAGGLEGSGVPLAVLPGGTSNVLAIELGIPTELEGAEALLGDSKTRPVRDGACRRPPVFALGRRRSRCPRDGKHEVSLEETPRPRGDPADGAVAVPARYEFPRLEVTVDGTVHSATFAVACRARHYAGKWVIAPEARLDADHFEVLLFSPPQQAQARQAFPAHGPRARRPPRGRPGRGSSGDTAWTSVRSTETSRFRWTAMRSSRPRSPAASEPKR